MAAPTMNLINGHKQPATCGELLKISISYFFEGYPKRLLFLPNLVSLFDTLVQDLKDPPLEIMWFYGAVIFHSCKPRILPPPAQLLVAKDLLETLNSCACLCNVVKKVAVIAPILYLLYHLELNFSGRDPSLREEIGIALEGIVSHISICCSQYLGEGDQGQDRLGTCILDLIRVWTVDQIRDSNEMIFLASFFPTLGVQFQPQVTMSLGYLAGVVMTETLFLRLCLRISPGIQKADLLMDMRNMAVHTIRAFQNFYFLDMLLKMLLEPSLPVAALLSSEDAVLLRKVLFDAVILIDYSFYSGRWVESSVSHSKKLALLWVLAVDHAINFARVTADETRVVSYLNAFHESQLVAELIKWVQNQAGMMNQNVRYDINTPRSLIYWLLVLEDQGIPIFDPSMAMLHTKAMNTVDLNKMADQEMFDQSSNGVPGYNCLTNTGKKRKEAFSSMHESQVKQIKLVPFGNSVGEKFPCDGMPHLERVVIDISSDDEMEL